MSTNGHHPENNGRDPLRADEWLEARHAANREQTSPFARGRGTNGTPPPPPPVVEDHDPTSLPIFAGAWASDTGATSAGIEVLADADGSYTKALGMNIVGEGWVNGRSKRYAMLVADGVVTELQVEESPGACALSSGDSLLDLI